MRPATIVAIGYKNYIIHGESLILCPHNKKQSLFSVETFFHQLVKHCYGVGQRHLCFSCKWTTRPARRELWHTWCNNLFLKEWLQLLTSHSAVSFGGGGEDNGWYWHIIIELLANTVTDAIFACMKSWQISLGFVSRILINYLIRVNLLSLQFVTLRSQLGLRSTKL